MANHKKLYIVGESQYYAVQQAFEVRLVVLQAFRRECDRRGKVAASNEIMEQIANITTALDMLNENQWEC